MAALHPNALQARVHKLLSSRAEIESTKALLSTLVASEPAPSRSTVQQQSHANAHAPATAIVTMNATSSLADLRKNLRSSLEEKQLVLAESVLQGLSQTLAKVSLLRENVESLDTKCAHIQTFLETTKRETQQVQAEAALLADKKEKMQHELDEIRAFLGRYQLSEQETQGLYAKNLGDEHMHAFLDTMERVQQVKLDCKALVASGDVNCGLELLDSVGKYQEVGFERLYQWTSKKCSEMEGEPSSQLHRAIALLRDRADFYNYCKECITSSRRSVLVRRFIIALTRGGPNGIPRPIEMHAHDPVRYCGDMLAWVHQAIATENEFFRVLFDGDLEFEPEAKGTSTVEGQEASSSETVNEVATAATTSVSMVGKAFEGVARPLQVRIEQTLSSQLGIVIAYKLVLLLAFYDHKFGTLVAHSAIARALEYCREASNRAFKQQFQMLVDAVASSAQDYSTNLSATHATMDASHRLVSLLEVFQTSLLPEDEKEGDLKPLFDGILPAVALMCERSVYGLDPVDALVFKVNNLSSIQVPLARFPEAAKWHTRIGNDIAHWLKDISELEMKSVLDRCNVALLLHSIHQFQTSEATASAASGLAIQAKGLEGETVATVMNGFCSALMTLVFPQIDQIAQPDLREKARFLTVTQLATTYAFVYDFVYDAKHGYRSQGVVLMHTPQEVRTVLEID